MASIFSVSIIFLLLAFFLFALLHCYAKLFLARRGNEGRPPPHLVMPGTHHLLILRHLLSMDSAHEMMLRMSDESLAQKGLDPRAVSSIPKFVFQEGSGDHGLECVICLSLFGNGEIGRRLDLCGHAFHVGCIDTWLHSHTTCPVCRASATTRNDVVLDIVSEDRREIIVDEASSSG